MRLLQIFRLLGAVGAVAIIASLFLPWVIRHPPDGPMEVYAGNMTIYGQVTADMPNSITISQRCRVRMRVDVSRSKVIANK